VKKKPMWRKPGIWEKARGHRRDYPPLPEGGTANDVGKKELAKWKGGELILGGWVAKRKKKKKTRGRREARENIA